jgi:Protein of unknown function (DUF3352)
MRRLLPFLALAALLAGCGSSSKSTSSSGGSIPAGASVVRADVLAFVSADSDLGSDQWQQLDKLAQKFPGRDQAVAKLEQQLSQQGVDYEQDVKPALGPESDLAVVGGGRGASTEVVALTKPDDPAKFKALVAKLNAKDSSGDKAVYQEVDGWYALSDSQAAISDVLKGDQAALADDPGFKAAMGKLPGDTLVKAYVDGPRLNAFVSETASQSSSGFDSSSLGLDKLKYIAASVSAEDDGVRLRGASSGGPSGAADFASELISGVPGDAFAFLDFDGQGTTDQLEKLKSNPQAAAAIAQLQQKLGVTFEQLVSLLGGEVAFYARQGIGIPELTLALAPQDPSAALATLDKLAAHFAAMSGGKIEPGTQGGHPVKTIDLGRFQIHYGSVDGKVLITSGVSGIADYGEGDHLPESADFKEAKDVAGMPDSTGGFLYLDLKDALPLLETFASLSGESLPSSTTENLRPLRSFLGWSTSSGEMRTFDGFLEIK